MQSIPSEMNAGMKMLEGEVLHDKVGFESWIRAFSVFLPKLYSSNTLEGHSQIQMLNPFLVLDSLCIF